MTEESQTQLSHELMEVLSRLKRYRKFATLRALAEAFLLLLCENGLEERWNYLDWKTDTVAEWVKGKTRLRRMFVAVLQELDPLLASSDEMVCTAFDNAIDTLLQQGCLQEREENLPGRHSSRAYRLTPKGVVMLRDHGV